MNGEVKLVYKDVLSPVGAIRLVASGAGLVAILWEGEDYTRTKLPAAEKSDNDVILLQTAQQLQEYFDKKRTAFDVPLDFRGTEFQWPEKQIYSAATGEWA